MENSRPTSLLRADPCEEIAAVTDVEAWSIPDDLIAEIYKDDAQFQKWCSNTVFPGELAKLLDELINSSERSTYGLRDILNKVLPLAKSIEPTSDFIKKADANMLFL